MTTSICATVYLPYLRTQPSGSPPIDGAATARALASVCHDETARSCAWFWLHLLASFIELKSCFWIALLQKHKMKPTSKRAEANTHLAQVQKCVPINMFPFKADTLLKNEHATQRQWLCVHSLKETPQISHTKLPVCQGHRNSSKLKGPFKGAMVVSPLGILNLWCIESKFQAFRWTTQSIVNGEISFEYHIMNGAKWKFCKKQRSFKFVSKNFSQKRRPSGSWTRSGQAASQRHPPGTCTDYFPKKVVVRCCEYILTNNNKIHFYRESPQRQTTCFESSIWLLFQTMRLLTTHDDAKLNKNIFPNISFVWWILVCKRNRYQVPKDLNWVSSLCSCFHIFPHRGHASENGGFTLTTSSGQDEIGPNGWKKN